MNDFGAIYVRLSCWYNEADWAFPGEEYCGGVCSDGLVRRMAKGVRPGRIEAGRGRC